MQDHRQVEFAGQLQLADQIVTLGFRIQVSDEMIQPALADAGRGEGTVTVRVPGGEVKVEIGPENSTLSGPSAIIALGTVDLQSLR